jgi:hypothetical protein
MVAFHGHLLRPLPVSVIGDPGNVNPAALEMNKEKHEVGHQPRHVKTCTVKKSVPQAENRGQCQEP